MWKQDHCCGLTGERSNRVCGLRLGAHGARGHKKRQLFSIIHFFCVCQELQNILLRSYNLLPTGHKVVLSVICALNVIFGIGHSLFCFVSQRRLLVGILRVGTTNM